MSITLTADDIEIKREFNDLMANCVRCSHKGDKPLIRKAFQVANEAHRGMRRKSGEPFILHPISVAKIVNQEMGLGATSVCSALLHDVVEDSEYTVEDIENMFGTKIASIVDGLTKISGVFDSNSSFQAENFRKMLLTLAEDVRVIMIKLADRLHNMRTLGALPGYKQMKISAETLYLFAPLAHRMGFYSIKTELEDLSLKYRFPDVYNDLVDKLRLHERDRELYIEVFAKPIREQLGRNNVQFEIGGRQKSIYSIWHKMQAKNVPFEEIYDLMAMRIVFKPAYGIPEKTQCWNIYSIITDIYMPKPERIRDWVSTPKANGYEALHATVMGPRGNWVEIQIRSERMDEIAERGFAAHWKYKNNESQEHELDKWLKRIREMLDSPQIDALEFLDDFKLNLFASEIFVFTPKGDMKKMPNDCTALDLAYEIHTEIGHKAIGAKVNHKLVPLNYKLKSGDQVEIITSDKYHSRREWLPGVITAKAKSAIKNAIKAETKNRIEKGIQILEEELGTLKLRPSSRIFKKLMPAYEVSSKDELYSKIGSGIIVLDDLKKILKKNTKNKWIRYWSLQFSRSTGSTISTNGQPKPTKELNHLPFLLTENVKGQTTDYNIAPCCKPIPGDDVIGFFDAQAEKVLIHKTKCSNSLKISSSQSHLLVPVKWTTHKVLSFLIRIAISGIERFGIYNDITTVISKDFSVNIRSISLSGHDGIWDGTIDVYVHSSQDLNNLVLNLGKIRGVESVSRMEDLQ